MSLDTTATLKRVRGVLSHLEGGVLSRRSRQMLLPAALTGVLTGGLIAAFEFVVNAQIFTWVLSQPLWLQAVAPMIGLGLCAVILSTMGHGVSPEMSDAYIRNVHDARHRLDQRPVVARVAASIATLSLGGSMGYEGPSIYLGAAIGSRVQSLLSKHFTRDDAKTLMVAGAAAGMAAIFKAPATGAVFAIEVPFQEDMAGRFVLPALCASAVSYATFATLRSTQPLLAIASSPRFDAIDLGGAALLGLICGLAALLFVLAMRATRRMAKRVPGRWAPVRVLIAGIGLAVLAAASYRLSGQALTLGAGYRTINWAADTRQAVAVVAAVLVLRGLAVLLTMGGGGAGGLFIPLVTEGALLGHVFGRMVGAPSEALFPVLGIAGFVAAGYRCPLTAVMFVAETTGRPGFVVPALLAAVVAHLVMGDRSVAPDQVRSRSGHLEKRFRLPVGAAMEPEAPTIAPDTSVEAFLHGWVEGRHPAVVPVVDGDELVGMIGVAQAEAVPSSQRRQLAVAEALRQGYPVGRASWTLRDALSCMAASQVDVLPIVGRADTYQGVLTTRAILALGDVLGDIDDEYSPTWRNSRWNDPLDPQAASRSSGSWRRFAGRWPHRTPDPNPSRRAGGHG